MAKVFYIMGVSGCGKSTISELLAKELNIPFYDGDDFHPAANIEKMQRGQPLNDKDRIPWLNCIAEQAKKATQNNGAVIACSALKISYRRILDAQIQDQVHWVFLDGTFELIQNRVKNRSGHFMPADLLQSQFDTLEKPKNALRISILEAPDLIIKSIMENEEQNNLSEFGLIGLGVMGKSLALNLAEKGYTLALYNRYEQGVEELVAETFITNHALLKNAKGFEDLRGFVQSLAHPRKIMLMIKAGPVVDQIINAIVPHLDPGDILIDGGNSHYKDTKRRIDFLAEQELHFIGTGVSGGEEGARKGPSIMPGGSKKAYPLVQKYLETIAAKDASGKGCCTYIGNEGAGHFVKMVHNGIEYAEMQLIAESYSVLRFGAKKSPDEIATIFEDWSSEGLNSYLLEITIDILRTKENEDWLINKILDKAGNKGTGSWTTISAAELGVPITMITAALFARYVSSFKKEREANAAAFNLEKNSSSFNFELDTLKNAYRVARFINHHQGFDLIQTAGFTYDWNLNLNEIARIWTNGCIIRSGLMEHLAKESALHSGVLKIASIKSNCETYYPKLGALVKLGVDMNTSLPCFSAAFNYLTDYTSALTSANIIQAQRDYFGAHTYQRNDDPSGQFYHTNWKTS